ncbi:MAG TPA: hypothetical protein DHV14_13970 [Micrococcales bacterium]|uniref:hypothetical protein n=1 Tax=Miniimonas arenae TaxID=676201 RepID=UPI000EB854CF|nr:hypothetical protein [Miniimonas arenae]HCX86209.1 hypothetical protein [Micrococcales bacterium]
MSSSNFKINRQGIAQFTREIEREFAKNPIRVPVVADTGDITIPSATVVNYHGPVVTVTGDHAQLAWNNETVKQGQKVQPIAEGYETLAATIAELLALLDQLDLDPSDAQDAREQSRELLEEVTKEAPDRNAVRRGVTMLKGLLAAAGTGVRTGVSAESAEAARALIEQLGNALPG